MKKSKPQQQTSTRKAISVLDLAIGAKWPQSPQFGISSSVMDSSPSVGTPIVSLHFSNFQSDGTRKA